MPLAKKFAVGLSAAGLKQSVKRIWSKTSGITSRRSYHVGPCAILWLALLASVASGVLPKRGVDRDHSPAVLGATAQSAASDSNLSKSLVAEADDVEVLAVAGDQRATSNFPYMVQPGDTMDGIARKLRLDSNRVARSNNLDALATLRVGDLLLVDLDVALSLLVVQPGEDFAMLAGLFRVPVEFLAAINNRSLEDRMVAGQSLIVPQFPATAAVAAQPDAGQSERQAVAGKSDQVDAAAAGNQAEDKRVAGIESEERSRKVAPTARGGRDAPSKQEEFIAIAGTAAREAQANTGVPASVTVAQAILESNWGKAAIGNNYFGIKAETKPGPAGVTWSTTKEHTGKGWITIKAPFRAYENMAQSFTDHSQFFVENSRYAEAMEQATDPKAFAKLIHKAGYATDPKYAQSLIRLMDSYNLYQFDRPGQPPGPDLPALASNQVNVLDSRTRQTAGAAVDPKDAAQDQRATGNGPRPPAKKAG